MRFHSFARQTNLLDESSVDEEIYAIMHSAITKFLPYLQRMTHKKFFFFYSVRRRNPFSAIPLTNVIKRPNAN